MHGESEEAHGGAEDSSRGRGGRRAAARTRLRFCADDRLVALVRRGDPAAFEAVYDRHAKELLSFCRYMLGSHHDAEDALQATFASAHRALIADERAVALRPWLFAIARNACLSMLRQRRPCGGEELALAVHDADPLARVEQREDLRQMLATILELPERQRTALVLTEMHGLSQEEIGALLGVRATQVKSYVYQARSTLISERSARRADCREIREQLSSARGAALLKGHLRRHLRSCTDCNAYAKQLSRQRRQLGALLPIAPTLALKRRALELAFGKGVGTSAHAGVSASTSGATTTVELAGGGLKVLAAKVLAGVACIGVGTGAGVGSHLFSDPARGHERLASMRSDAFAGLAVAPGARSARDTGSRHRSSVAVRRRSARVVTYAGTEGFADLPPVATAPDRPSGGGREQHVAAAGTESAGPHGGGEEQHGKVSGEAPVTNEEGHGTSSESPSAGEDVHGKAEEVPGRPEESHGKNEESHGKNEEPHGSSEERAPGGEGEEVAHGKSEEPHGKSGEAHGGNR